MELLKAEKIEYFVGSELLFQKDLLKIHSGDRIGLIGKNGSGKSTLLEILKGVRMPDQGLVVQKTEITYLDQGLIQKFPLSGGEEKKFLLFQALHAPASLLFLDEPDNHLDAKNINYLIRELQNFSGAFLLVTHSRFLLNCLCTQIWEIENQKITIYPGNFDDYEIQKEMEKKNEEKLYREYQKNKRTLIKAMQELQHQSAQVRKTPSRMGNSEARLHKMGDQRAKKNLNKAAGRVETRINQLKKVPKPTTESSVIIDLPKALKIHSPYLIQGKNISKKWGDQMIFKSAEFSLLTGSKTALIGENGSGKSTLLEMIRRKEDGISYQKNVRIGSLGQFFELPEESTTLLEQVTKVTVHDPSFTRLILARLLFRDTQVHKLCRQLSGGELTKVGLAMLILGNYNVLLLDEPTNHLDLFSIQAVEAALKGYHGTVLFTSHDPIFIQSIATEVWQIQDHSLKVLP